MKLLSVSDNVGHYRNESGKYGPIDKIGKEDLLRLVNWALHEKAVEFDPYDEKTIKNQSHQIIYKSVLRKLSDLRDRRQKFLDESARLYLDDYQKYRDDAAK
jgi:hypothetical protein